MQHHAACRRSGLLCASESLSQRGARACAASCWSSRCSSALVGRSWRCLCQQRLRSVQIRWGMSSGRGGRASCDSTLRSSDSRQAACFAAKSCHKTRPRLRHTAGERDYQWFSATTCTTNQHLLRICQQTRPQEGRAGPQAGCTVSSLSKSAARERQRPCTRALL